MPKRVESRDSQPGVLLLQSPTPIPYQGYLAMSADIFVFSGLSGGGERMSATGIWSVEAGGAAKYPIMHKRSSPQHRFIQTKGQ